MKIFLSSFLLLAMCAPDQTSAASPVVTIGECGSSDFSAIREIFFSNGKIILASDCSLVGQLALINVPDEGGIAIVKTLPPLDPGTTSLERITTSFGDYAVFTKQHEPTGDDETYYMALVGYRDGNGVFIGDVWSYGAPTLASTATFDYVSSSVNPYGWTEPDAPGWPILHEVSGDRLVGAPLSRLPEHSCDAGRAISEYLDSASSSASKLQRRDQSAVGHAATILREFCAENERRRNEVE